MTRQYNQVFTCVNCGCVSTTETSFGRWVRENPNLDSKKYDICIYDIDYVVHKYRTYHGRGFQLIMFVEVKTRNSTMTDAQRDTMYIASQITSNRRRNPQIDENPSKFNTNDLHAASYGSVKAYSTYNQKYVDVKSFGVFNLCFSGLGPEDSKITWNGKVIDADTLTRLLRFDIDPVRFNPIEELFRVHHREKPRPLFDRIDHGSHAILDGESERP